MDAAGCYGWFDYTRNETHSSPHPAMLLEVLWDVVGRGQDVRRAVEVPNQGKGEPAVTTAVPEVREHGHPHKEEDGEHLEELCVSPAHRLWSSRKKLGNDTAPMPKPAAQARRCIEDAYCTLASRANGVWNFIR